MQGNKSGKRSTTGSGDPDARYQHLVENIQDAVVEFEFVDGEPIVRSVNDAFEDIFGYDGAAVCGDSLNDWIVPEGQESAARDIDTRTENGDITAQQLTRRTADGMREFLHRSIPYEEPGTVDGIALYTDITERERAGRKRRLIAETSQCIGAAQTLQSGFETTLQSICRYTEWVYGEVWQPSPDDGLSFVVGYADDADCEPFMDASRDVTFTVGEGLPGRVFKSGSPEWIADVSAEPDTVFHRTDLASEIGLRAAFGAPVIADGIVVAVLVFFLREHRQNDRMLTQQVTDVAAHLGGLVARKQAEEAVRYRNEQLKKFSSMLSHDLRNPLTVILGRLDQFDRDGDNGDHVAAIERSATRMEEMVTGLLRLARAGQHADTLQTVSLATVAESSWDNVRSDGARLDLRVPATTVVDADRGRLMNVFENLFRNAREHNELPLTLVVGLLEPESDADGAPVGFFVEDDGEGIPGDRRDGIFEYGYTTTADGTGFGLSIVKQVVEAHGWTVSVRHGDGSGARFEIRTGPLSSRP